MLGKSLVGSRSETVVNLDPGLCCIGGSLRRLCRAGRSPNAVNLEPGLCWMRGSLRQFGAGGLSSETV
eukprot:11343081-Alexandrium_andersonii.AAC.1